MRRSPKKDSAKSPAIKSISTKRTEEVRQQNHSNDFNREGTIHPEKKAELVKTDMVERNPSGIEMFVKELVAADGGN